MTSTTTKDNRTDLVTWEIDPAHTHVGFDVQHMMFAKVRGSFRTVEGTLHLGADNDLAASQVRVVIDSASIDTGEASRDQHLRSSEFFDVERFPTLSFVSRSVTPARDGGIVVKGDLTIRDVTRAVELQVRESGAGRDPWGKQRIAFTAQTTVDRRDFGLTWNQALETGGILVGNEVRISLEVQAVKTTGGGG